MTIDEAIKQCNDTAEQNEKTAQRIGWQYEGTLLDRGAKECRRFAAEHRQLAEWLRELQQLREKHWDECRQIAHYDNDLKEVIKLTGTTIETALENLDAKDLIRELATYLYEAIDGFRALGKYLDDHCKIDLDCEKCPLQNGGNCRSWKHTKAVLKLIGGI